MKMKLQRLRIANFMGCKELDIEFDGSSMKVYGDNATGKTTIQHAFNWLLFDKNAYGKTDFGIKPYNGNGEVIHRLETTVEALFEVDGSPKSLKKVFQEKWTRKRGSAEDTYSGNETSYYVNTVPKKKKEFTEEIANLIKEDVFKMITNPLYFNENLDWKDRRKMLMDICGNISDEEVIMADKTLTPLLDMLNGRTVEELRSIVSSEMKSINKELGIIPSRIAEAELAKPTLKDDVDVSALDELSAKRGFLTQKKSDILNGAEILRLKAEYDSKAKELESKRAEGFNKYTLEEYKGLNETDSRIKDLKANITMLQNTVIPQMDMQISTNATRKKELSEEWDRVFKQTFLGATCPTCKQELPPEQVEEKKKEFNVKKASQLDTIEKELNAIKDRDNNLIFNKAETQKNIEDSQQEIENLTKQSAELTEVLSAKEKEFEDKKNAGLQQLTIELNDIKNEMIEQELNAEDLVKEVDLEIKAVDEQIKPLQDHLSQQNMVIKQNARILELKEEQENLSAKYSDLDRKLFLTEEFIRVKVSMITVKVNQLFKYASFKLFDEQVNGGISETCEVTYKGVPYRDLNTAGRINIGLDIINTLSTKFGVVVPVFVDGMESVTKPIDTVAQRIELIVSENDKTLRFEKVEG